jgi:tetratricopeptide (TPR) repeat protein
MRVDGDELVYEAVTCAACGAKVREDRPCCLRCGERLVASVEEPASGLSFRAFAIVAVCLALTGMGVLATRTSPREDATAPTAGTSRAISDDIAASARPSAATASADTAQYEPDPVVAAWESRQSGAAAYSRGDMATALEQFTEAVESHPEDADALNNLGQVLVRSGRANEAIQHFDKAIELAGDTWAYHFNRARAYADLQDWPRAIAGYRDAVELFPDDYVTHLNLARALQASGDLPGAIAALERTIQLAPGEPDFYLLHAGVLDKAQLPTEAAAAYRHYLELDPATAQAEKIKARIAQLEGRT